MEPPIEQATAAPGEQRHVPSMRERAQWAWDNEHDYWAGEYLALLKQVERG